MHRHVWVGMLWLMIELTRVRTSRVWWAGLKVVSYVGRLRRIVLRGVGRLWRRRRTVVQECLLLSLGQLLALMLLALVALGRGFQFWEARSVSLKAANHSFIIRRSTLLLRLLLLSLGGLAFVLQMWRYPRVDVVDHRNFRLDQPRGTSPSFSGYSLLDE